MRGNLGGADPLFRAISNRISGLEKDEVVVPKLVSIDDMLWKFAGSEDPKPFSNCSKEELLQVVKTLLGHIQEQNDALAIQEHSKQALLSLMK